MTMMLLLLLLMMNELTFQGLSIVDIGTFFEVENTGCTRGHCLN